VTETFWGRLFEVWVGAKGQWWTVRNRDYLQGILVSLVKVDKEIGFN